jgi:hypothetical protein
MPFKGLAIIATAQVIEVKGGVLDVLNGFILATERTAC